MKKLLRPLRITLATATLLAITLLFLDFTGTAAAGWGFLARWQLIPAVLSLNVAALLGLVLATLLLGRVYCSVICPLGVMQDAIAWLSRRLNRRKRYSYSAPLTWLRIAMLALFVATLLFAASWAGLLDPYSSFGRIATSLLKPLYVGGNNLLAANEPADSYRFATVVYSVATLVMIVAIISLLVVGALAWRGGRTYCNTVCPVGTILGYLAKHSWLRPVIDHSKCVGCGKCARTCKASCIDAKQGRIDLTRCVACMDCLGSCSTGAISYAPRRSAKHAEADAPAQQEPAAEADAPDGSRRDFLTVGVMLAGAAALHAQEKSVDGGLAPIADKLNPTRRTPIAPPGAMSHKHLADHCTACQLCITSCPNGVLRPSTDLTTFMQPTVGFEAGYCRPECTTCGSVCPVGAILPLSREERASTQVGHAEVNRDLCLAASKGVRCDNCARHCPAGAITMVPLDPDDPKGAQLPAVASERCIGCGACENLCPVRPVSAIHVEGHEVHRTI